MNIMKTVNIYKIIFFQTHDIYETLIFKVRSKPFMVLLCTL